MANPEHLAILKQGVEVWNEWRRRNPGIKPDISDANLINSDIRRANLAEAILFKANLGKANINGTDFHDASLVRANLSGASLRGANLRNANLREANLTDVSFNGADLQGANFDNARVGWTVFVDVNLSTVQGLTTVEHLGPFLSIDTIFQSRGKIPEVFLHGCGVPENFITYTYSLVAEPIDFYSCFISHSAKDKRFCERLHADLQAIGVRVWYFPEDAKWGEPVWGEIDRSIKVYDKLIVVCSENSLQSGPVNREIERALNREDKEGKGILFPIRIDGYIFDHWEHERKADVLRKVVGDFSGWDKDAAKYDKAFDKLLKGLQAEVV